jgi:UDP-N-acetylmuramyl pentapeptide phosphotransferase/UDP-N-acetylglucosamine-1-phosphate transferase
VAGAPIRAPCRPSGWIAIYAGFVVALLVSWLLGRWIPELQRTPRDELRLVLLFVGATLTFAVMWLDDVVELPWLPKFGVNILAGVIAVLALFVGSATIPRCLGHLTEVRSLVFSDLTFRLGNRLIFMPYHRGWRLLQLFFRLGWMTEYSQLDGTGVDAWLPGYRLLPG